MFSWIWGVSRPEIWQVGRPQWGGCPLPATTVHGIEGVPFLCQGCSLQPLALLSDFGLDAVVETCFKGDLCVYNANGSNPNNSEPNCGTIIGKTWSFNSGYLNTIHLTNEGYSQGDVIHVYHHKDNCNNETLRIKTFLNGNWTTCWVSYSCSLPTQSSLIFNGEYWEELE